LSCSTSACTTAGPRPRTTTTPNSTTPGPTSGESSAYLRHHLALAGRDEPLFADDAIARLHRASGGLPRALNNAATAAIIAAAADNKTLVDDTCAKRAVAELTRD
jgi:type II secretory pathway predicted ATPase ExeA